MPTSAAWACHTEGGSRRSIHRVLENEMTEFRTNQYGQVYPISGSTESSKPHSMSRERRCCWWVDWNEGCWPTQCPRCKAQVFFVRHNGGCAWFDALGSPWPKHECLSDKKSEESTQYRQVVNLEKVRTPEGRGVIIRCIKGVGGLGPDQRLLIVYFETGGLLPFLVRRFRTLRPRLIIDFSTLKPNRFRDAMGYTHFIEDRCVNLSWSESVDDIQEWIKDGQRFLS